MGKRGARRQESAPAPLAWDRKGNWIRVAMVAMLVALSLFPLYFLAVTSLKTQGETLTAPLAPPMNGLHFENWATVLPEVATAMWNSTVICVITTALVVVFVTPCAYVFCWHRFPGKQKLYALAVTMISMPAILTFVPQFILVKNLGLLNNRWGMILIYTAGGMAISLLLLRSFLQTVPTEVIESARIDGASELRILLQIVVPLAVPSLITVAVINFSGVWNAFMLPLVLLSRESQRVATVAATFYGANPYFQQNVPLMMSAYLVSSAPLIITMALLLRYFMAGATQGALKG